jgi:CheY-like chemotaxis protein
MTRVRDAAAHAARVLVIGPDEALLGLLEEWLDGAGWRVAAGSESPGGHFDAIIVDLPFSREDGARQLRLVAARHPATPVLALSSNFFAGVGAAGAVARSLGVARVLPKPVAQEALLRAVDTVLEAAA